MNESFSVGRAFSLGFSTMFRNFIPFVILGVIVYIPLILYSIHAQNVIMQSDGTVEDIAIQLAKIAIIILLMTWVLKTLLGASVTYGVVMQIKGTPAGIGSSVGKGLARLLPVLGVGILVALITVGPMVLIAFVSPILILAWIPFAIILYCMYYVSVPASVCEKPGIAGALARSRDLTTGYKGGIFGMLFLLGLIDYGIGKVLESMFEKDYKMLLYTKLGADLVLGILGACICASTYYLLRSGKEGTSADELASVFD